MNASNGSAMGHRRAKSSIGMNRKFSGKNRDGYSKAPPGPTLASSGALGGTKKSSSSQRGAIMSNFREKNSSSAMAQLQPRGSESGPKIPTSQQQLNSEDMLDEVPSTYLSNN